MSEEVLGPLRERIDGIDAVMVDLLARRFAIVREVVEHKRRGGIPARLTDRVETVVDHVRATAERAGCPPDLAEQVWRTMIEWIIGYEERQLAAKPESGEKGHG